MQTVQLFDWRWWNSVQLSNKEGADTYSQLRDELHESPHQEAAVEEATEQLEAEGPRLSL